MATYGKAIAQGGALGGAAMAHRSRETADEAWLLERLRFDRCDGLLSTEALVQPACDASRGHGQAVMGEEREQDVSWAELDVSKSAF